MVGPSCNSLEPKLFDDCFLLTDEGDEWAMCPFCLPKYTDSGVRVDPHEVLLFKVFELDASTDKNSVELSVVLLFDTDRPLVFSAK